MLKSTAPTDTRSGLGPLSALELYYGRKINPGWGICFLLTSQMIGYAFTGIYRDILVRPPKIYYPGGKKSSSILSQPSHFESGADPRTVLPNVALFNAMHKNPSVTKKSLRFFAIVACATFCYQWIPGFIFPLLSSLPLLCYFGHGQWKAYLMGSGYCKCRNPPPPPKKKSNSSTKLGTSLPTTLFFW